MTFTDRPQRQSHVCVFLKCVCVLSHVLTVSCNQTMNVCTGRSILDMWTAIKMCVSVCDSHNRSAAGEGVFSLMSWIGKRLIFNRWLFSPRCEKAIHQSASVHFYQTTTRRSVSLTNENAKVIHVQLQQTKQTDGKEKEWERERSCRKEKKMMLIMHKGFGFRMFQCSHYQGQSRQHVWPSVLNQFFFCALKLFGLKR